MPAAEIHDLAPLLIIIGERLLRTRGVGSRAVAVRLPLARRHVAAGHVLPDEDSLTVAMPVPAFGFDLDMFADHIESQLLREPDIVEQRLVGRGRVEAVGPPALVERAEMEERPAVERHALDTVGVAPGGDLAQRGVGFGTVDHPSVAQERHGQVVEIGIVGTPQTRMFDGEVHRLPGHAASLGQRLAIGRERHADAVAARAGGLHVDRKDAGADVAARRDPFDTVGSRNRFDPHRLPDTRHGRVPDAVGFEHLFAVGLETLVGRIGHLDRQLLHPFGRKRGGDVEREGGISARMTAYEQVVDIDLGTPVHRAEMEQHVVAPAPCGGHFERGLVPQRLLRRHAALHARQRRFDREGHQNPPLRFARSRRSGRRERIVPQAVEIAPPAAHERRTRVFGQRSRGIDLGGPTGFDPVAGRFPRCLGRRGQAAEQRGRQQKMFHRKAGL